MADIIIEGKLWVGPIGECKQDERNPCYIIKPFQDATFPCDILKKFAGKEVTIIIKLKR